MDVLSYLSELIQTRKAVGIYGLGTVLKIKLPGRFDADTHSFVPPSYTLDFTAEVKEETSLADFISKKRNVSAETAKYFVNEFSAALVKQLNDQHEADLGDLGKLVKSGDTLKLIPAKEINYGFDFYGLPAVKDEQESQVEEIISQTPEVEEPAALPEEEEPAVLPEEEEEPAVLPEEEPTIESVVADNESQEENPGDHEYKVAEEHVIPAGIDTPVKNEEEVHEEIEALNEYRSKMPYLKDNGPANEEVVWKLNTTAETVQDKIKAADYRFDEPLSSYQEEEPKTMPAYLQVILGIAILGIMLAVAYFVKPEWFTVLTGKDSTATTKAVILPATKPSVLQTDTAKLKDSAAKVIPVVTSSAVKDSSSKIKTTPAAAVNPADTATVYEIIGASMHDQKEADSFIALMKKSGINAKVVTNMSGKRLKMSIATLKDEKSAKLELDRLSKKLKIPGIYIYRNKQQ